MVYVYYVFDIAPGQEEECTSPPLGVEVHSPGEGYVTLLAGRPSIVYI